MASGCALVTLKFKKVDSSLLTYGQYQEISQCHSDVREDIAHITITYELHKIFKNFTWDIQCAGDGPV